MPLDKLLLAFLVVNVLTIVANGLRKEAILGQYYRYEGLITLMSYIELYWIYSRLGSKELGLEKVVVSGGAVVAGLVILQWLALHQLKIPVYNQGGRLAGLMGNPNFAGAFLALSFAFGKSLWWGLLFVPAILATGSRSALLAFGLINILMLLNWNRRLGLLVALGIIVGLAFVYPKREKSLFDDRFTIWARGIEAVSKKPILGWGPENFETAFRSVLKEDDFDLKNIRVDKAHNESLEVAVSTGVIGLMLYWSLTITAIIILWKSRSIYLYPLLAFCLISSVNVVNVNNYIFYYLGLAAAALDFRQIFSDRYRSSGKRG